MISEIKRTLSNYIGPIAGLICEEYIETRGGIQNLNAVNTMIDNVAREIGDPDVERLFKIKLKDKIIKKT